MTSSDTRNGNVIPGRDELVARAHALQPLLREYAAKTDAGRCLPDAVNAALTEAGFFRLLTPQRFVATKPACGRSPRSPRRWGLTPMRGWQVVAIPQWPFASKGECA
jgi:hypothetical protein